MVCYKCGKKGHFAWDCWSKKKEVKSNTANVAQREDEICGEEEEDWEIQVLFTVVESVAEPKEAISEINEIAMVSIIEGDEEEESFEENPEVMERPKPPRITEKGVENFEDGITILTEEKQQEELPSSEEAK
ncbi:hypothetical protein CRG98_012206 [Punica granatum]|uniref:CCHC-type domain-containing protein n=1 Tax=Punica granatum TaxID=22663 RepID=A0A2I0KFX0_PUNGR|nr:hypothetical protein CRG98_012206 [Punica granatum]